MSAWSKIGKALKGVARVALPAVARAIPGIGAIAGPVVGAVLGGGGGNGNGGAIALPAPIAGGLMPGIGTVGAAGPVVSGVIRGTQGMVAGVGAMAGRALGLFRTVTGKITGVMTKRGWVSRKKAAALAKGIGIDAAAVALGITAVEMAELVLEDSKRPRRAKGISGSDIKRTKRTIGTICRITKQFADVKSARRKC